MQWLMKRFSKKSMNEMSNEMKSKMTPDTLKFMNACGILYFLTVACIIVLTSYCLTLPSVYSGTAFWIRAVIGILIVIQVSGVDVSETGNLLQTVVVIYFLALTKSY